MPRVTDAHRSARHQQILKAAWQCFARDGFHGTSMQDIFEESGLSAGAVYRYFPNKLALVRATAEAVAEGTAQIFDELERSEPIPSPSDTFRYIVETAMHEISSSGVDFSRVAIHVWAEALREPEVGVIVRQLGRGVRQRMENIAARWKPAGYIAPDVDPADIARLLYGAMVGFAVQRNLLGDVTPEQYAAGLTALINSSPGGSRTSERDESN